MTAQVQTQGSISVYLGAGVDSTGTVQDLSGATALVNNLDVQILKGATGLTTLDYSGYQDFVTVNLSVADTDTGLYDASGLAGVQNTTNVIGAGGEYGNRSEEHTSELQSLMRISYAVFCLKKKNTKKNAKY